jgi:hypothetical protein
MPVLTLAGTLAVAAPERNCLVEADDAIHDVASAIEDMAGRDGLDRRLVSQALVDVMIAAAARQALSAYPSMSRDDLAEAFRLLAAEAFEWASGRGVRAAPLKRGE